MIENRATIIDSETLSMSLTSVELKELQMSIADRLYIQVESWHLYLGDAGLSETLAIECNANLDDGVSVAARKAIEAVQVQLAGGSTRLPLARLIPPGQLYDLEELLNPYC